MSSVEENVFRVAVGSTNPSKIRSVQQALEAILNRNSSVGVPKLDMQGLSAPSGVPDQPMGDSETKLGARNRAKTSFDMFVEKFQTEPHLAIGLEGGLEETDDNLVCMAWMAVFGKRSKLVLSWTASQDCGDYILAETDQPCWGISKTATFSLPPKICELVKGGLELGHADDQVFSRVNGKHGSGTVGILTNGLIDRSLYYEHALQLAMIPWIRPDVYP
jgi:inosine/xanthosine triphosphatase